MFRRRPHGYAGPANGHPNARANRDVDSADAHTGAANRHAGPPNGYTGPADGHTSPPDSHAAGRTGGYATARAVRVAGRGLRAAV